MRTDRMRGALAVAALTATVPALAAIGPAAAQGAAASGHDPRPSLRLADQYTQRALQRSARHAVVVSGLDNPRQLAWDNAGRLLVAEAGHGSYGKRGTCLASPEGKSCVGRSGKVSRIGHPASATNQRPHRIARGFLSAASPDGSFAIGSDGVSQGRLGRTFVQETAYPPAFLRSHGFSGHQNGKLLTLGKKVVADISGYEFRHNPDGETIEPRTDPYAVLALKNHQLVADAAGNDILRVRNGHLSVWAMLPGNTKKVDPVPTSLAKGRNGSVYVGTLYSLAPNKARVLHYSAKGKLLRSWYGFTSVTGVVARPNGHVYVSELFSGCPQGGQNCIPGRVVNLAPDGSRSAMRVPFPAGLAWRNGHLYVSAWSTASHKGLGAPGSSGQVWRLR
jgi:hypothetical protein